MHSTVIANALAAPAVACRQLATPTGTPASRPIISNPSGPPPGHKEVGPAAWTDAGRAGGTAENRELLTEAGAASLGQASANAGRGFPVDPFARLMLVAWPQRRMGLIDGAAGHLASRWGPAL